MAFVTTLFMNPNGIESPKQNLIFTNILRAEIAFSGCGLNSRIISILRVHHSETTKEESVVQILVINRPGGLSDVVILWSTLREPLNGSFFSYLNNSPIYMALI
ncbi:hypothetical protein CEXT_467961 [Caerostris extrusa]|uniref:Uncharacterized protein n=1 Tax=Caerostris extrusa TaxID=172846 RepID=A0AAV4VAJ2_CAEEX|nr:hypothetical protein CEXT_467961 [Caerostris extrusa]